MEIKDLEIYNQSVEISRRAWLVYDKLNWQQKKIIGDQWITSVDSVGANIAEGFGRFHYLDKNKFNYNARGFLLESIHWTKLLFERNMIPEQEFNFLLGSQNDLLIRLNAFIRSTKSQVKVK